MRVSSSHGETSIGTPRSAASLSTQARALYRIYTMRRLSPAEPARRPVRPDRGRNLVAGALVGLFVGLLAAVAGERLRPAGA